MKNKYILLYIIIFIFISSCAKINLQKTFFPNTYWYEHESKNIEIKEISMDYEYFEIIRKYLKQKENTVGLYIGQLTNEKYLIIYLKGYENDQCLRNHEIGHLREEIKEYIFHTKYTSDKPFVGCSSDY